MWGNEEFRCERLVFDVLPFQIFEKPSRNTSLLPVCSTYIRTHTGCDKTVGGVQANSIKPSKEKGHHLTCRSSLSSAFTVGHFQRLYICTDYTLITFLNLWVLLFWSFLTLRFKQKQQIQVALAQKEHCSHPSIYCISLPVLPTHTHTRSSLTACVTVVWQNALIMD